MPSELVADYSMERRMRGEDWTLIRCIVDHMVRRGVAHTRFEQVILVKAKSHTNDERTGARCELVDALADHVFTAIYSHLPKGGVSNQETAMIGGETVTMISKLSR